MRVDFRASYIVVVTIVSRAGGRASIERIDDDGTTLTVIANQSGGCSGIQQPAHQETFTVPVATQDRKVRVELVPVPGPTCNPRLS